MQEEKMELLCLRLKQLLSQTEEKYMDGVLTVQVDMHKHTHQADINNGQT